MIEMREIETREIETREIEVRELIEAELDGVAGGMMLLGILIITKMLDIDL